MIRGLARIAIMLTTLLTRQHLKVNVASFLLLVDITYVDFFTSSIHSAELSVWHKKNKLKHVPWKESFKWPTRYLNSITVLRSRTFRVTVNALVVTVFWWKIEAVFIKCRITLIAQISWNNKKLIRVAMTFIIRWAMLIINLSIASLDKPRKKLW